MTFGIRTRPADASRYEFSERFAREDACVEQDTLNDEPMVHESTSADDEAVDARLGPLDRPHAIAAQAGAR